MTMTMRRAVEKVLVETGNVRGNPAELAKLAMEKLDAHKLEQRREVAIRLFMNGHTEAAIRFRDNKPEPTFISSAYAGSIRNNWLLRRGVKYDKRTYRDVPGRNMIEPKHPAIVAAQRLYANAA